jgi:hypothetical protein
MHLKIIHKLYFHDSDDRWCRNQSSPYYVHYNPNEPIQPRLYEAMEGAYGAVATDVTGWDRYMPEGLIQRYFYRYLARMSWGVPEEVLHFMYLTTVHSILLLPDGSLVQKHRGNPSGYPNTIRLNCVVHRAVNLACMAYARNPIMAASCPATALQGLEEGVRSFYCGDDGINFPRDQPAWELCHKALEVWKNHTTWTVKLEGQIVYDQERRYWETPSFVSRIPRPVCGVYYHVLHKPAKVLCKLYRGPKNQELTALEERREGVLVALGHGVLATSGGVPHKSWEEDLAWYRWFDAEFNTKGEIPRLIGLFKKALDRTRRLEGVQPLC